MGAETLGTCCKSWSVAGQYLRRTPDQPSRAHVAVRRLQHAVRIFSSVHEYTEEHASVLHPCTVVVHVDEVLISLGSNANQCYVLALRYQVIMTENP